jgi:hypothetical protein
MEFHETGYGRRFFDSQLPMLIGALERIADALEKADRHAPLSPETQRAVDDLLAHMRDRRTQDT